MKSAVAELEKRKTEALKGRFQWTGPFFHSERMFESWANRSGNQFTLVEGGGRTAPEVLRKTQLWVAAANPDQASNAGPLRGYRKAGPPLPTGGRLPPEQAALLNLKPRRSSRVDEVRPLEKSPKAASRKFHYGQSAFGPNTGDVALVCRLEAAMENRRRIPV